MHKHNTPPTHTPPLVLAAALQTLAPDEGFNTPETVITNFYNATMLGAANGLETSQMITNDIPTWTN